MIINEKDYEKVRREIDKLASKGRNIVVQGQTIEFNRKVLENKKVVALILSHKDKKDRLKQRDSGLNQVLCKIARDKDKLILIDLKEIIESKEQEKALILGRLMQNIMLLKKYNVKTGIINKSGRDEHDIFSLLLTLGASTKFAKDTSFRKVLD